MPRSSTPHLSPTPRGSHVAVPGRVAWIGLGLAAGFWLVDAGVDAFLFHEQSFVHRLLPLDDPNTLLDRGVVVTLLLLFSVLAGRLIEAVRAQLVVADHARREARAVLDATSDAMVWVSDDGRILAINRPFGAMFAVRADELVGQPTTHLVTLSQRCLAEADAVLAALRAWVADPDGDFVRDLDQAWPVERKLALVYEPVPGIGRLFLFRDVTRERAVDRMKSEFVSLVSHELRTPLTSIKGYVELVLGGEVGPVTADQREFLGIADRNVDRLVSLINELLDISRIEAGKLELHRGAVNLARLLQEVASALRPQIDQKRQSLLVESPDLLLALWADPDRLTQVVTNLLSNAHKFTPPAGQIACTVTTVGDHIRIAVRDMGIGMTGEQQAHVFDKFYWASDRTNQEVGATGESGGTGLGLSIAKALVELHGGTITVASAPGEGSTFTVTLPLLDPSAADTPTGADSAWLVAA